MARRRGGVARFGCQEPGCVQAGLFDYRNQDEAAQLYRTYDGRWRCLRHSHKESWLTPESVTRTVTLIAEQREYGRFWGGINNGFAHGPGFMAYADEFPAGSELTVTASIKLPSASGER